MTALTRAKRSFVSWWLAHSPHERQLFALLAAVVVFFAVINGVWRPIRTGLEESRHEYAEARALWRWMQEQSGRIKALPSPAPAGSGQDIPLSTLLTDTSGQYGLSIKRIELAEDDKAALTLEHIPFNRLINWLDMLENDQHMNVLSLTVTPGETPGTVSAVIQLQD